MKPHVDDATSAELRRLELSLMQPDVRHDRNQVSALLHEDFLEFGSSGRVWTRTTILDALAEGAYTPPAVDEFACHWLANDVVLVTYRAIHANDGTMPTTTLRSSIWTKESCEWKMRFHQGTRSD